MLLNNRNKNVTILLTKKKLITDEQYTGLNKIRFINIYNTILSFPLIHCIFSWNNQIKVLGIKDILSKYQT